MKFTHIEKGIVLLSICVGALASVKLLNGFNVFTEPSHLFLGLSGLGLIALGRLRRV